MYDRPDHSAAAYATLNDSEKCLFELSKVPDVRCKLQSMLFMTTCAASAGQIGGAVGLLREGLGRVLLSQGLAEVVQSNASRQCSCASPMTPPHTQVMRCILAIGNAMNQGTWKGAASGFRLSALSKLHQVGTADDIFCFALSASFSYFDY